MLQFPYHRKKGENEMNDKLFSIYTCNTYVLVGIDSHIQASI